MSLSRSLLLRLRKCWQPAHISRRLQQPAPIRRRLQQPAPVRRRLQQPAPIRRRLQQPAPIRRRLQQLTPIRRRLQQQHSIRPPTRRWKKAGCRGRIRPITKVPSKWHIAGAVSHVTGEGSHFRGEVRHVTGEVSHVTGGVSRVTGAVSRVTGEVSHITGEVSHVYKKSGLKISNIIQCLPPPSIPKSASDVNNSVRVPVASTDALSETTDTSRTCVHDQVHTSLTLINTRSVRNKAGNISDYITVRVYMIRYTPPWH